MSVNFFDESHWREPRATIANIYKENDYGYVFHATSILIDILEFSNLTISECKNLKVLDYGCGTARVSRQFALTGAHVEAYDPVPECVAEAANEFAKIDSRYKMPKTITTNFEEITDSFDLIFCVNVLEHLDFERFQTAISNIETKLKEGGQTLLWVRFPKNDHFIEQHGIEGPVPGINIIRGIKTNGKIEYSILSRK